MGRFSDWSPAEQPGDPTPGDAFGVRGLASRWDHVASVASDVQATVERVQSASGSGVWVGQAGDVFRDKLGDFPTQIWQVRDSFSQSRDALNWWASMMEAHQSTADQGLAAAVAAQADLASAEASLASAQAQQQSAQSEYSRQSRVFQQWGSAPADQVPSGLSVPSGSVVRSLYRQQQDAASRVGSASSQVGDAQSRLDAARRLVAQAKQSYQEDAHTAAGRLQAATDSAIPRDSWWEKLTNSDAWKVLVDVAGKVAIVVGVAALLFSGPVGWVLAGAAFAAGAVLLADSLSKYAQGEGDLLDVGLAALSMVPGAGALGGKAALGLRGARGALQYTKTAKAIVARGGRSERLVTATRRLDNAANNGLYRSVGSSRRQYSAVDVRFSQKTVSYRKPSGWTYDEIMGGMRSRGWRGDRVDVVRQPDGRVTSVDNTRIRAARETDTTVEARIHNPGDRIGDSELAQRLQNHKTHQDASTWGEGVANRIRKQGAGWSGENPLGSDVLPRVTGVPIG